MYEIQTRTITQGWINTWKEDDKIKLFGTEEEAKLSLAGFLKDVKESPIEGEYSPEDYRIVPLRWTQEEIETINNISGEFSNFIVGLVGSINMSEINRLNRHQDFKGECASHIYCDANQALIDAFLEITGEELEVQDDKKMSMCFEAWDIAKLADFNHSDRY